MEFLPENKCIVLLSLRCVISFHRKLIPLEYMIRQNGPISLFIYFKIVVILEISFHFLYEDKHWNYYY